MTISLVVEMSGAHGGILGNALRIVDEAAAAGATAIKTQMFDPIKLAHKRAIHPRLIRRYSERELLALYVSTHTPEEWIPEIVHRARTCDLEWYSSIFEAADAARIAAIGSSRIKISSFEYNDINLLKAASSTGLPIVVSIMLRRPVSVLYRIAEMCSIPRSRLTVLAATDYAHEEPSTLPKSAFKDGVLYDGLSDHTKSPPRALYERLGAAGARMIERHIHLPDVSSPDDEFSSTPEELKSLFDAASCGHETYSSRSDKQ